MKANIKYGVVAALTMAAFVAGPVSVASAYTTVTETADGKTTTTYNYTDTDEINALKAGTLTIGSSHAVVYSRDYNGEELSAEDLYIKYTDPTTNKTQYAQVSATKVNGIALTANFFTASVTNGKLDAAATTAATDTSAAGYYGVTVTVDSQDISLGVASGDSAAIQIKQTTVSGSTLTTSAAKDKTLVYGDVEAATDGYTAKIGSVSVDAGDVKVYKSASDREKAIKGETVTAETGTLNAGTYYVAYELTSDSNVAIKDEAAGNKRTFLGTLTVSKANIATYFEVKADNEIVELSGDGAKNTFTFTKKSGVTVNVTAPTSVDDPDDDSDDDTAHYSVAYKNNTSKGTATATITGMNNYTGTISVNFVVTGATLDDASKLTIAPVTYTGSAVDLKTITYNGTEYSTGFTVSYAGAHTAVADSGVKVTVKGDGSSVVTPVAGLEGTLTISALDLSTAAIKTQAEWAKMTDTAKNAGTFAVISSAAYSTTAPSVTVYANGNKVASSVYKVEFEAATKAGQDATLKLTGVDSEVSAGNVVAGTANLTCATTKSIDSATVSGVAKAYTYNGESKEPVVTVKAGTETLIENVDYVVSYKNNVKVGTGSVVITGMGDYAGSTKTVNFYIDPAKSSIKSIAKYTSKTIKKNALKVSVKNGSGATGVEIAYRVKGTTKWTKVRTTIGSKVLKNLKSGKQYQITVRSYTKNSAGKVTNYSGWSATKTSAKVK